MLRRFIIVFVAISFLWVLPWIALSGTFSDNFDDGDLTGWKPNFAVGISVVHEKLQFKGGDALIAKVGEPEWSDYSLKVRVKVVEFVPGGWFSVRVLQDNTGDITGYYELHLSQRGIIFALYMDNHRVEAFQINEPIDENVWQEVKIIPLDGKILLYLDELLIAQLTDVCLSGYIDMCATKGTHVYVDDVSIAGPANIPDTGPSGPNSFVVTSGSKLITTWGYLAHCYK